MSYQDHTSWADNNLHSQYLSDWHFIETLKSPLLRSVVIPPNSNTFSDWRRTCHVSLVKTSWRPRANKTSWLPRATTTWTFDSHVIRSCTFETAANLYASRRQANNFYLCIVLFWVGRYNKTLNDWPLGKQWVLFPLDLNVSLGFASGKQNSLFPLGPVIKCLLSDQVETDSRENLWLVFAVAVTLVKRDLGCDIRVCNIS